MGELAGHCGAFQSLRCPVTALEAPVRAAINPLITNLDLSDKIINARHGPQGGVLLGIIKFPV